jgi:fumarate reductase flavoprotein subunit
VDETIGDYPFESVNAILLQPEKVCYALLDDVIRKQYEDTRSNLDTAIQKEVKKDNMKISDSWDDISEWIGADPNVIKQTVEEYNSFCDQGYDVDFAKDRRYLKPLRTAPLYAIRTIPVFLDTLGGIKINDHMEVMDIQGEPIPGLYAAGVTASGWMGDTYCGELSGSAFSFAINSGRIAGEGVARYIGKRRGV